MVNLSFVVCVLAIFAFAGVNCASQENAPAPAVDCSTIIFSMADCLSFVTNGSKITKPEGGCCSGLKTVLKTDAECLCETFKSSGTLGVVLNVTKALSLPSACGVTAPSITKCGLSDSPGAAPAQSPNPLAPSPESSTPVSPAPVQTPDSGTTGSQLAAPAPAPSDASAFSISFVPLLVSLVAAACCSFV